MNKSYFRSGIRFFLVPAMVLWVLAACSQEEPGSLAIGDKAPSFTLQDLQGNTVRLSDYAGSPVVLRFFLTDCKFCRADTPILNEYYERYREKGLRMLYIDTLGVERTRLDSFVEEFAIGFPVAQDSGSSVSRSYKVRALPQTIVLSPEHAIIGAILGGISEPELNRLLSPYLDK